MHWNQPLSPALRCSAYLKVFRQFLVGTITKVDFESKMENIIGEENFIQHNSLVFDILRRAQNIASKKKVGASDNIEIQSTREHQSTPSP